MFKVNSKDTKTTLLSQLLQISMDRLYRITGRLQNQIQSTKSRVTFSRAFLKLKIIRLAQEHWSCTQLIETAFSYNYTYEKTYLAVNFTKGYFLTTF